MNFNFNKIDCIILCGGLGKRLRGVLGRRQKVLAQVGGRPFLDLILNSLKKQGCRRVILCTGYQAKHVEAYYTKNNLDLEIVFSQEGRPLGTGGAIKHARPFIRTNPFLVFNGDSFCPVDLKKFLHFHKTRKSFVSVVIAPAAAKKDYGSVAIDGLGQIISFSEKRMNVKTKFVNAGIYCFDRRVFRQFPRKNKFSIEYDFFEKLGHRKVYGFPIRKRFVDIGTPERLNKLVSELDNYMKINKIEINYNNPQRE